MVCPLLCGCIAAAACLGSFLRPLARPTCLPSLPAHPAPAGADGIDTLILLDRCVDMVTPMCTQVCVCVCVCAW